MQSLLLRSFESKCATLLAGVLVLITAHMTGILITPEVTVRVLLYISLAQRDIFYTALMIGNLTAMRASIIRINVSDRNAYYIFVIRDPCDEFDTSPVL
jgi:hypothetical protein